MYNFLDLKIFEDTDLRANSIRFRFKTFICISI